MLQVQWYVGKLEWVECKRKLHTKGYDAQSEEYCMICLLKESLTQLRL